MLLRPARPLLRSAFATVLGLAVVLGAAPLASALPGDAGGRGTDAGLSAEERAARHEAGRAAFEARFMVWQAGLDVSRLDPSALARTEILASSAAPPRTIESAVGGAEVIVSGVVTAIRPEGVGSVVTFEAEGSLKGGPPRTLTVVQGGGFAPTPAWDGTIVTDMPGAPTLLPGDRAVLLLTPRPDGDGYAVQPFTGTYRVVDDAVQAVPGNPLAASLDGLPEAVLLDLLRHYVR